MKDDKGKESNNRLEQANVIPFNTLLKGSFMDEDYTEIYTFNVSSPKEMNISVINECKINMTGVLFHESDMKRYVAGETLMKRYLKESLLQNQGNIIYMCIHIVL